MTEYVTVKRLTPEQARERLAKLEAARAAARKQHEAEDLQFIRDHGPDEFLKMLRERGSE